MVRITMLIVTLTALSVAASDSAPADEKDDRGLFIRLAESSPDEGRIKSSLPDSEEPIYLHAEPLLTAKHVASVRFSRDQNKRHLISLDFSPEGAERLAKATEQHMGKRIAIQLDGEVIMAPIVQGVIFKRAMITGEFNHQQMRRIFEALVLQDDE